MNIQEISPTIRYGDFILIQFVNNSVYLSGRPFIEDPEMADLEFKINLRQEKATYCDKNIGQFIFQILPKKEDLITNLFDLQNVTAEVKEKYLSYNFHHSKIISVLKNVIKSRTPVDFGSDLRLWHPESCSFLAFRKVFYPFLKLFFFQK